MVENVSLKMVVNYNGHSVKQSGVVNLSFKADYSELANCVGLFKMLNNDVKIVAKVAGEQKAFRLGTFKIKSINIFSDGQSKVNFTSITDFVEVNNLNSIVCDDRFIIKFDCQIESEEENE